MLLRTFQAGGTWERIATLQQIILSRCLYTGNRTAVETAFGADIQILLWNPNVDYITAWPPGWALIKSGSAYFLNVAGTTSLRQVGGHIWGSLVLSGTPEDPTWHDGVQGAPNWAWQSVFNEMRDAIRAAIPLPWSGKKLCCFGHSYGAAVAAIAAQHLRAFNGFDTECITIAAPKVWTLGTVPFLPPVYYRIEAVGDLVTTMPQGSDWCPVILKSDFVRDYLYPARSFVFRWEHQGTQVLLQQDGTEGDDETPVAPLPLLVTTEFVRAHFTSNYFGRVRANALKVGAL